MPTVLHVLPADAPLSCPGLEDWLSAGAGFTPLFAADETDFFAGRPVLPLPVGRAPWTRFKPLSRLLPGEANPWVGFLRDRRVDLVHLHDLTHLDALAQATDRLELPLVLSWPRGGSPDAPLDRVDRVLVPTLAQRDRLMTVGCPANRLVVAPVPVAPQPPAARRAPLKGQPLRWISAALEAETQSLALVLEAFLAYRAAADHPATLRVLTTAHLADEAEGLIAELGLTEVVECGEVTRAATMRQAFLDAHLGVFPLEPAEPDVDAGLTWPAWVAAATGLPLVLGPEGATDGFRDGQEALVADLEPGAIARKMHFLAQRPFAWPNLGQQAAQYAATAADFHQACQVPYQVYKDLLRPVAP